MSPVFVVILVSAIVVALVLIGSMYVISKGYAYKQEIDPMPEENELPEEKSKEH
jgi:cell division protein FtsL